MRQIQEGSETTWFKQPWRKACLREKGEENKI